MIKPQKEATKSSPKHSILFRFWQWTARFCVTVVTLVAAVTFVTLVTICVVCVVLKKNKEFLTQSR